MRIVYLIAGCVFLGLGLLGVVLPIMPTTVFIILAAGCFARSSPRLERWLLAHKQFGPTLRRWRERGAIARPAKAMALTGMAAGFAIFLFTARPEVWLGGLVALALIACGTFVMSRPDV